MEAADESTDLSRPPINITWLNFVMFQQIYFFVGHTFCSDVMFLITYLACKQWYLLWIGTKATK